MLDNFVDFSLQKERIKGRQSQHSEHKRATSSDKTRRQERKTNVKS